MITVDSPYWTIGRPLRHDGITLGMLPLGAFPGWHALLRRDPCSYCNGPAGTVDHIVPRSRGGRGLRLNLTSACGPCNQAKAATPLLQYLLRRRQAA